jgi:hypothetical protein
MADEVGRLLVEDVFPADEYGPDSEKMDNILRELGYQNVDQLQGIANQRALWEGYREFKERVEDHFQDDDHLASRAKQYFHDSIGPGWQQRMMERNNRNIAAAEEEEGEDDMEDEGYSTGWEEEDEED